MLKKMAETMSLEDISAHLLRKPARCFFSLMKENVEQEVELERKIGTFCSWVCG